MTIELRRVVNFIVLIIVVGHEFKTENVVLMHKREWYILVGVWYPL